MASKLVLQGWKWTMLRFRSALMVLAIMLCVAVAFGAMTFGNSPVRGEFTDQEGRPIREIREDVRSFLGRARAARTDQEKASAVCDLCELHREIVRDDRYRRSRSLQTLRSQIGVRLRISHREIKQHLKRGLSVNQKARGESAAKTVNSKLNTAPSGQGTDPQGNRHSFGDFDFLAGQMAEQMSLANQMSGGPSQVFAYASGRFAGPDFGPDLVKLIEETINPDFWEVNGGPGRIHYYKPLMIIVVAGSMETHRDLESMLKTLRRLSR